MKLHVVPALYAIWVSSQPITSLATSREVWPAGEGGGVGPLLHSLYSASTPFSQNTPWSTLCPQHKKDRDLLKGVWGVGG